VLLARWFFHQRSLISAPKLVSCIIYLDVHAPDFVLKFQVFHSKTGRGSQFRIHEIPFLYSEEEGRLSHTRIAQENDFVLWVKRHLSRFSAEEILGVAAQSRAPHKRNRRRLLANQILNVIDHLYIYIYVAIAWRTYNACFKPLRKRMSASQKFGVVTFDLTITTTKFPF